LLHGDYPVGQGLKARDGLGVGQLAFLEVAGLEMHGAVNWMMAGKAAGPAQPMSAWASSTSSLGTG